MRQPPGSLSEMRGYREGPEVIGEALAVQRRRFVDLLGGLSRTAWDSPSRCAGWSVHDVARHVRDGVLVHVALLAGRPTPYGDDRFDPRTTPAAWLARTEGATPAETLADLRRIVDEEAGLLYGRNRERLWTGALRRKVHPSTWSTHVFWDAWMHEADVAVALGLPVRRSTLDLQVAALYGLLVAAEPSARTGDYVDTVVALDGSPSGAYRISHVDDDIVVEGAADADASLRGEMFAVLDSLAGRGAVLEKVLDGPAGLVQQLGLLRAVAT
jgi:uncharacterized protein (TIGR03083 family)